MFDWKEVKDIWFIEAQEVLPEKLGNGVQFF